MSPTRLLAGALLLFFLVCSSLLPAQAPPATPAADLVKQGEALTAAGQFDQALDTLSRALDADPKLADAHLAAGVALDLKGQYKEARAHFAKAIELTEDAPKQRAMRAMAFSYAFEGQPGEAAKYEQPVYDARLAKQDYPAAGEIANELGRIYLESGDTENAYKWYKTGYETAMRKTDMSPADKNLWAFRITSAQARIAARRGEKSDAQQQVTTAKAALDKAKNPDQARFYPYLTGYVAFYAEDYKTAIADLTKADEMSEHRDPFVLVLLAQAHEKAGDQARATELYKQVMAIHSHNPANAFARPIASKKAGAQM